MDHFSWFTLIDMLEHDHMLGAVLVLLILTALGLVLRGKLASDSAVIPDSSVSFNNFFQIIGLDFLFDILVSTSVGMFIVAAGLQNLIFVPFFFCTTINRFHHFSG